MSENIADMSARIVTTIAELNALTEGSVILSALPNERPFVALKPRSIDYPANVHGIWETSLSESAMSVEALMILCNTWQVVHEGVTAHD